MMDMVLATAMGNQDLIACNNTHNNQARGRLSRESQQSEN